MVRATSARPRGGRLPVPAKITSSILPPRSDLTPCSPSTQAIASTTLDLPDPLGPTITVIPGSKSRTVLSANDLNPRRVSDFRNTRLAQVLSRRGGRGGPPGRPGAGGLPARGAGAPLARGAWRRENPGFSSGQGCGCFLLDGGTEALVTKGELLLREGKSALEF